MLLLVADTSGKQGGVGLVRAGEGADLDRIEVIEEVALVGGTFSAQLVPQIAVLLSKHGLNKRDINAFIVVSGPGSFTGLRVGLAAIKALAEILRKPIAPVSLLEVLALAARVEGRVVAALDAGRGEVYVGEYRLVNDSAERLNERLLPGAEFLSAAAGSSVVTTSESLASMARIAGLSVVLIESVNAAMIAHLGWKKLRAAETVTPEELEANYIRRSDAEIFAKPASNS
jgi:tRNA threonylcarbamoyladenosine biosynthesis protein TsaB